MLWQNWSTRELQEFLGERDPRLLEQLEEIIPPLSGEDSNPTDLYLKRNLIKIVEAFTPSDCFRDKSFRRRCLNGLSPEALGNLTTDLGLGNEVDSFDEQCAAIVAKGWTDESFARAFLEHFKLPAHFLSPKTEPVAQEEDIFAPTLDRPTLIDSPYKPLKDFQCPVYARAIETLTIPRARFVIQMPTGSGKTRTAMEVVSSFLTSTGGKQIVVWLAHSEELCEQAFECFRQVWCHEASFDVRVCRAWGNYSIPPNYDRPMVVIGGFQKLYAALRPRQGGGMLSTLQSRIGLIVVDEAHRTIAPTYKKVVGALSGQDTKVIGLTATPARTENDEAGELVKFYFNELQSLDCPDDESEIAYLRSKKVLAKLNYEPLITGIDFKLSPTQKRYVESHFDLPKGVLRELGGHTIRNLEIMKRLLKECEATRQVLFFGCSVEHSRFITALLLYFGVAAAHIDGGTNRERRRAEIASFKTGDIQVLSNYGILSAGFDAPNTDVVFISRPTGSAVLYSQMIGRGLRGPAIGGTESCKVIDVRDNIIGFGDQEELYLNFQEYWSA